MTENTMNNTLERIARRHLDLETLDTRNSDSLDFQEQAVWSIRAALEAAYRAGREAALLDRIELDEAIARAQAATHMRKQAEADEAWIQEQREAAEKASQLAAYEASENGPHDEAPELPEDQKRPPITSRAEQEA